MQPLVDRTNNPNVMEDEVALEDEDDEEYEAYSLIGPKAGRPVRKRKPSGRLKAAASGAVRSKKK